MAAMSEKPVVDFDHHSAEHGGRWAESLKDLRSQCPVAWSNHHDGFWVLTRHADVWNAARDFESFSTEHDVTGDSHGYGGIAIPPSPSRATPLELDPPEFTPIRQLLNPTFSPSRSRAWKPWVDATVAQELDRVVESGEMDLIYDLGAVVPGRFTMKFLGLPETEWKSWALPFHEYMSPPGTPQNVKAATDLLMVAGRLHDLVQERRACPQDDYVSYLVGADVEGESLSDETVTEIAFLIIAGGVDTTTSLFGCAAEWLARNTLERDTLRENPELWDTAIEEFLRYFSPTQGTARTVRQPIEVSGCPMTPGDRVLLSWAGANRDPQEFDEPESVRLDRTPNRHTAFGIGIHRCLGSNIARVELRSMLEALVTRVPDYEVDVARAVRYPSVGITNGFMSLPATFTPTSRTAAVGG